MDFCSICIENFNKRSRKRVTCTKCLQDICTSCIKRYILDLNDVPQCMNCKCGYTSDFLCQFFSNKFYNNELRESQVDLFYNMEKSKLVETAEEMEEEKQKQRVLNNILDKIDNCEDWLEKDRLRAQYNELRYGKPKTKDRKKVRRCCPANDCRGFLNENWICGICENKTCSKCNCIKLKEHECNKDDVESYEAIKKDTRSCPTCGFGIFKISGCSQMYCTSCHTCFDWVTMRICTGAIHNPHYFEYMRQNKKHLPRQEGDIPGTCVSANSITQLKSRYEAEFLEYFRFFNHLRAVDMVRYSSNIDQDELKFLRKQYLKKKIDESEWKKNLKRLLKKKEKNTEMNQILEMFCTAGGAILNNTRKETDELNMIELDNLKTYTNKQLEMLSKKFKNNVLYIEYINSQLRSYYVDLY